MLCVCIDYVIDVQSGLCEQCSSWQMVRELDATKTATRDSERRLRIWQFAECVWTWWCYLWGGRLVQPTLRHGSGGMPCVDIDRVNIRWWCYLCGSRPVQPTLDMGLVVCPVWSSTEDWLRTDPSQPRYHLAEPFLQTKRHSLISDNGSILAKISSGWTIFLQPRDIL